MADRLSRKLDPLGTDADDRATGLDGRLEPNPGGAGEEPHVDAERDPRERDSAGNEDLRSPGGD